MIRSLVSYCAHTFVLGRLVLNERGATKKAQAKGGEAEKTSHPVLLQLRLPTLQLKLASLFLPVTGDQHVYS